MSGPSAPSAPGHQVLRRRLGLTLLVLYGVGITVGAGIYVLIGRVAGHAGAYSPWAFVLAAGVMALTVASYAELSTRYPVSAGVVAYLTEAFGSHLASTVAGLLTIVIGLVSSAAVAIGAAGYVGVLVPIPRDLVVVAIVVLLGTVAAWGILESALLAGLFTLVEVGGLVLIVVVAMRTDMALLAPLASLPPPDPAILSGIFAASLLAFFAFIGFEGLANVAEEVRDPHRTLPLAMGLTLAVATLLYVSVAAVAVAVVPPAELARSQAPLSLVFQRLAGASPVAIGLIAIVATLNTVLAQMTVVTRIIYGMARLGNLPRGLGAVHEVTQTPVRATVLVIAAVLALALGVPLERLAEATSIASLVVFALVNLALIQLKRRGRPPAGRHVTVPFWVPVAGFATCVATAALALLI